MFALIVIIASSTVCALLAMAIIMKLSAGLVPDNRERGYEQYLINFLHGHFRSDHVSLHRLIISENYLTLLSSLMSLEAVSVDRNTVEQLKAKLDTEKQITELEIELDAERRLRKKYRKMALDEE